MTTQTQLAENKCEVCRAGAPLVTPEELAAFRDQIPDWNAIEQDGIKRLERVFQFTDFIQALEFTNRVGTLAEEEGHHPAIVTEWGQVTVHWWTHKINGLHRNDLIMASKTDHLYGPA